MIMTLIMTLMMIMTLIVTLIVMKMKMKKALNMLNKLKNISIFEMLERVFKTSNLEKAFEMSEMLKNAFNMLEILKKAPHPPPWFPPQANV